jgi:hypothetical protein
LLACCLRISYISRHEPSHLGLFYLFVFWYLYVRWE